MKTLWLTAGLLLSLSLAVSAQAAEKYKGYARGEVFITAQELNQLMEKKDPKLVVIAVASKTEYYSGHIPGSFNRFWQHNLGYDGRFLSPEELRAEFLEEIGEVDPKRVVHSCGSGVTACHNALAMRLAGLPDPVLYDGSYSEWVGTGMPIATGDEPGAPPARR